MKKFCLMLLLSLLFRVSFSQCRLSGNITSTDPKLLELVLLYGDGHYEIPSIKLSESGNGQFDEIIHVSQPVFALLKSGDWSQRLLLSPRRDLQLSIRIDSYARIIYNGPAAEENRLINRSVLDSVPFFMKVPSANNPYAKITLAEWKTKITDPIDQEIKKSTARINRVNMPANLKALLISETKYVFQCHLNDLANNSMAWAKNPERDTLLDLVMQWQRKPDSADMVSGFYANMMVDRQIQYRINKLARNAKENKLKVPDVIAAFFRMPFSHVDSLVKLYGERHVVSWLYARNYLPASMGDKILLNKILNAANNASFNTCFYLLDTLSFYYPESPYLDIAKKEVNAIRQRLSRETTDAGIHFRSPGSIHSLADLVKPYAGKIVYLDIWGTWCGPCKIEMRYVAALKKRFNGKDIVFVYLDMDDELKDASWKEYLSYYGIEGEHYRMNKTEIAPIWDELKAAGAKEALYPTFVLFDRSGKIITPDAERPTSMEKLYTQLDKVL